MSASYKVLAQSIPNAATLTVAYTVPALTSTVVSSVVICNQGVATSFRISVAVAALADTPKQYLFYDVAIGANTTYTATLGLTLATTDVIRVYATLATVSFNFYGSEVT